MKEKLTLEHLAPYLPYSLQLLWYHEKTINMSITNIDKVIEFSLYENILYKPILHPLSKLTEEIEHNGEKFIPIDRINGLYPEYPLFVEDKSIFITDSCELNMLEIHEIYKIYQKLFEWHFDVFELIKKGLAIEKQ